MNSDSTTIGSRQSRDESRVLRDFEAIIGTICSTGIQPWSLFADPAPLLEKGDGSASAVASSLNAAFLISLCGPSSRDHERAQEMLGQALDDPEWAPVARFYLYARDAMKSEITQAADADGALGVELAELSQWLSKPENIGSSNDLQEKIWSLFFPEGVGVRESQTEREERLRSSRTISVTKPCPDPVVDPPRQVIFTSNVLLTIPSDSTPIEDLPYSESLKEELRSARAEEQLFWYDHPIPIGVEPGTNEALYGMRGLEQGFRFERDRGTVSKDARLTCLLSVSVTHKGLQSISRRYLSEELERAGGLENMDVYAFSEADTDRLVSEILAPAAEKYLGHVEAREALEVLGVDGAYGRHYSFLKAITAFWNLLVDAEIKATFKIDLDQVFPQEQLLEQTGLTALEHLKTPLWGAQGKDSRGRPVELGLLAGALVNQSDIGRSLFTPDVTYPTGPPAPDEMIFHSRLPQALSTAAEMGTRYNGSGLDGVTRCLERIHVTGGTTGIRVDSLLQHRLFVPSFIGRAEDQAYILSALVKKGLRPAYLHKDGLIMRHDKEEFAQEAMHAAKIGKLLGDYVRIIYFSAYAKALGKNVGDLKVIIDPFTGCFVSRLPITVTMLRFALKATTFFAKQSDEEGLEFIRLGTARISKAIDFAFGNQAGLSIQFKMERAGWDLYYDTLEAISAALARKDPFAIELRDRAQRLMEHFRL